MLFRTVVKVLVVAGATLVLAAGAAPAAYGQGLQINVLSTGTEKRVVKLPLLLVK